MRPLRPPSVRLRTALQLSAIEPPARAAAVRREDVQDEIEAEPRRARIIDAPLPPSLSLCVTPAPWAAAFGTRDPRALAAEGRRAYGTAAGPRARPRLGLKMDRTA